MAYIVVPELLSIYLDKSAPTVSNSRPIWKKLVQKISAEN